MKTKKRCTHFNITAPFRILHNEESRDLERNDSYLGSETEDVKTYHTARL
jgi:hypothetical protein